MKMHSAYYNEYSEALQRRMEMKVFGHGGRACLVFPAQSGRFYDFENFGMVESVRPLLEQGRLQLFCCDSVDSESWAAFGADCRSRIEQHERWYRYIGDELVPRIRQLRGDGAPGMLTTGCSLGGLHAVNFLLRRPELFGGVVSLSGIYHSRWYFGDYCDDLVYINSPIQYLDQMPYDHPYAELYRHRDIVLCCGQGAWESESGQDTRRLQQLLQAKDIAAWVDYWGTDVAHDWLWWRRQFPYFMEHLC